MIKKIFFGLAFVSFLVSCSSYDDLLTGNEATIIDISTTVTSGNWRVSKYMDSDKNETHYFSGYTFVFDSSNVLTASLATHNFVGAWNVTLYHSDHNNLCTLKFTIFFPAPEVLEDLSDDWNIKSYSATKLELQDESGSDKDYLIFEKN